jgi:hypothetical protein
VFAVDNNSEAKSLFRHDGEFSALGLCVPSKDWLSIPQGRWTATPLAPALSRLYASQQCVRIGDVCEVRNGIKASPEKKMESTSPPSVEHVPWLQTAKGKRAWTQSVSRQGNMSDYIRYPGNMERPRQEWAARDSDTGEVIEDDGWRKRGIFARRKILIHKNADPASPRPLRALIDQGHYPSTSFHFAWLNPSLTEGAFWTYEALLAVLNGPVSQVCLASARTRNKPVDLIQSIPVPRLGRKAIDAITSQASGILRLSAGESAKREALIKIIDKQILQYYPLSDAEIDLFWQAVWGNESKDSSHGWTDKPWPLHGTIEAVREADESGPASVRIRIPGFRRGAQLYQGPIPREMPGWAMVIGLEFQAEIPWSDAEASRFDPSKARGFRPLPFAYEGGRESGHGDAS